MLDQVEGLRETLAAHSTCAEVLADLILTAPPDEQSTLMADMLANLGGFLLEKKESAEPTNPRCSRH
jgi:hypothetical protein